MSTVNWDLACKAAEAVFYALSVAALLWKFGARDGKIHAKLDVLLERTEKQARELAEQGAMLTAVRGGLTRLWRAVRTLRHRVRVVERGQCPIEMQRTADGGYESRPYYSPDPPPLGG